MGEENVFYCWAGFEPSKSAIFGKKHVTALGSASCCNLDARYGSSEFPVNFLTINHSTGFPNDALQFSTEVSVR